MIFERKYPLCYNIPYDDASWNSPVTVTKTRYIATDGKFIELAGFIIIIISMRYVSMNIKESFI